MDIELENLKRFIADGGRCWRCGDTGSAEPTFTEPSGSACECGVEDSALYTLEHWDEIVSRRSKQIPYASSADDILEF